jgi:cysteinyl-tRNA synthetase
MIREELGETIDIHLGGADLIFPHHENEIAQSEAANGAELARYWLHNGFVTVGEEKMAKSLGNFTTIRDLIGSGISPMTIRLFVLQAHYRKPIDFNSEAMIPAINGWKVLNAALGFGWHGDSWHGASRNGISRHGISQQTNEPLILTTDLKNSRDRFISALNDDLNTSVAISELFYLARPIVSAGDENREILNRWGLLCELAGILGLVHEVSEPQKPKSDEIQALIEMRNIARANRDYEEADRIRELLVSEGIMISDGRVSG